jgi:hypothetical protein
VTQFGSGRAVVHHRKRLDLSTRINREIVQLFRNVRGIVRMMIIYNHLGVGRGVLYLIDVFH